MRTASALLGTALCAVAVGAHGQANWSVVETPPIDSGSVVMTATAGVHKGTGGIGTLTIICYGGRIEISVDGPAVAGEARAYAISYRLNDGPATELGTGGRGRLGGLAFPGNAKQLLQSLPAAGSITIRLAARTGIPHEATFLLDGIGTARDKAVGCAR